MMINEEAIDKVSKRLWKTQGGVYAGGLKSKEYAKLSLRERVDLKMKQDEIEERQRIAEEQKGKRGSPFLASNNQQSNPNGSQGPFNSNVSGGNQSGLHVRIS